MVQEKVSYRINVHLLFPPDISSDPVVCQLPRLFDVDFNIIRAQITPKQEGFLTLELLGERASCDEGIAFLKKHGIEVTHMAQCIWHDEDLCMHCGMCTSLCPTHALSIDANTRRLVLTKDRCTVCGRCLLVCPVRALQMNAVELGTLTE